MFVPRVFSASISIVLLTTSIAYAQEIAWTPGVLLGRGYDALTGQIKEDCMTFSTTEIPTQGLHNVDWSLMEISSNADLVSMLAVSATASLDLGIASGSAEANLVKNSTINNFNANYVASARAERAWNFVVDPTIKESYENRPADDFRQQCGNKYVSGVLYGGVFYTTISVETNSIIDKEAIGASIAASIGPFSGSGDIRKETDRTLRNRNVTIKGQYAGSTAEPIPLDFEALKQRFSNFPTAVVESGGTPIRFVISSYPGTMFTIPGALDQLLALYWDFATLQYEITYVIDHPDQFYMDQTFYLTFLENMLQDVEAIVNQLKTAAEMCADEPNSCLVPDNLTRPNAFRSDLPPRYESLCGKIPLPGQIDMTVYPLNKRCGGDKEMGGHNPKTRIFSVLDLPSQYQGKIIHAYTYVKMREGRSDWTCFETQPAAQRFYYNVSAKHPGCYLKSKADIFPQDGTIIGYGGNDNHAWTWYGNGTGILTGAECRSDTDGDDFGRTGCRHVRYGSVELTLSHEEDRKPPSALEAQAARVWLNQASTRRRINEMMIEQKRSVENVVAEIGDGIVEIEPRGGLAVELGEIKPIYGRAIQQRQSNGEQESGKRIRILPRFEK